MAETIILNIASKVLGSLGSLAINEVGLGWGLDEELKTLEGTLSTIKEALSYAEEKQGKNHVVKIWYERLQATFYEADNLLDEFQYEALRRQVQSMKSNHHHHHHSRSRSSIRIQKLVGKFFSCCSHSNDFRFKFEMGNRIGKIKKRLDMIGEDRNRFYPIGTTTESKQTHHNSAGSTSVSSDVNESEFFGRANDRLRILLLLMTPHADYDYISVIPIVGIAGVGKTAFVKIMYNDERVVEHFGMRIWVKVAQDFNVKRVVQKIIQCITDSPSVDFSPKQTKAILAEKLQGRRFLLVLDDVCNCDNRDWVKLLNFLRHGNKGSKIIVTTRYKSVASTVGTVPMHNLTGLPDDDCRKLLWSWAFRKNDGEQHRNFSEIGKEILEKCHGYPRAIKTLGNLLFMKNDENEWLYLKGKELWELEQNNKHDILPMLRLKYNPLPTDLKRCFVYCSIFPKNYEIEIDKLIQLWMAQGLIQSSGLNHKLEDIGADYLNQLCSIFFFEKIEQHGNLSNTCRMPEIIHDLAVYMANEESISTNYRFGRISKSVSHVPFHDSDCSGEKELTKSLFELEKMRTVLFPFHAVGASDEGFVDEFISRFKYLRVFDLSNSSFRKLSHSIGNLKHLRFLDFSGNANIETLPNAICKLYNLQTLRIEYCVKIRELPKNIGNLISLRNLNLTTQQSCLPDRQIRRLTSLQSFRIIGCGNLTSLPEGMQHLTALTTVTIAACPKLASLPSTMKNLANLRNLEISNCPNLNLAGWEEFRGLRMLQ
ncbi:putative disease resistance protein RGA1 [Camellia sinensis]|uniref:Uncharacterized protein n=1 Tax=Camellia sinensis var. sinensis TaxID=542762 RepID=A0A4S4DX00_CAMSN|nr:putative disease resistance protein RGA1 [Camellia sinensis]THG07614.1 hypothetical protein TEA_010329 [Camellia sinensis var. sinensis]